MMANQTTCHTSLSSASRLLVAFSLATVVAAFVVTIALKASTERGRLSIPPTHDDVSYLYWSQLITQSSPHQSVFSTFYQILDQHSPLTTLFGVLGYAIFNGEDLGPYIVAAVPLIAFIGVCFLVLDGLPIAAAMGVVGVVGSLPLLRNFVTEFRPEPVWGELTAISAISFFMVDFFSCSCRKQIGLGLLAGLAVISKPTASLPTIVVLGTALLTAGLVRFIERSRSAAAPQAQTMIISVGTVLVGALLVIAPVGAIIGRETYDYIVWVMRDISPQVQIYGGFAEHALFYWTRSAGRQMLGLSFSIFLVIWSVGAIYAARSQRFVLLRVFAILVVVLISYAVPAASPVKFVWFGAAHYSILVLATLYLIGLLCGLPDGTGISLWLRRWLPRAIFVLGAIAFLTFNLMDQPSGLLGMDAAARADMKDRTTQIWSILRARERVRMTGAAPGHVSNVMTIAPEPIVGSVISLYGAKENLLIRGLELSYARSIDELKDRISDVDYVVVGPSYQQAANGSMLGDDLDAIMDRRGDFSRIATVPFRRAGSTANIYERIQNGN
jgi:hypothetical protein